MTIKTIFTFYDSPVGKNGLKSRASYMQRVSYQFNFDNFIQSNFLEPSLFFDCRSEFINYGKLNKEFNPIHVSETNLKQISDADGIMAINFVVDAFHVFKNDIKAAYKTGIMKSETFENLNAKKSWSNVHFEYHEHLTKIFVQFLDYCNSTKKNKKIVDFSSFMTIFISYLDLIADKTPILKSSYVLSRDFNMTSTGLVVETDATDKDKDEDKFKKYFSDPDYLMYCRYARKNGFAIDKNCPWRLIFDISLQESEMFLKNYNVDRENVIQKYFYETQNYDLENLKTYMIIFYNTLVDKNSTVSYPKIITANDISLVTSEVKRRIPMTMQELNSSFENSYWFKLFSYILMLENKVDLNQNQYELYIKELIYSFKNKGFNAAVNDLKNIIDISTKSDIKKFKFS